MTTAEPAPRQDSTRSPAAFAEGQKLAGCYVLRRCVRVDLTAPIWLAYDEALGKDVSLHFLPTVVLADSRAMAELRQEIKRNRQLIHPNILRVYDLVEETDWTAISMDSLDATAVADLLRKKQGGAFDVSEIERWIPQLSQTIDDAHRINVLHRALEPGNIFLDARGKVLLANFGVGRCVQDALQRSNTTGKESTRLAYLSPQQLDRQPATKADDVYAFGVLLFELLTGTTPFGNGDLSTQIRRTVPRLITQQRSQLGQPTENIPSSWDQVVAACLDKDAAARPKSLGEIARRLSADPAPTGAPVAVAAPEVAAAPERIIPPVSVQAPVEEPAAVVEKAAAVVEKAAAVEAVPAQKPKANVEPPLAEAAVAALAPVAALKQTTEQPGRVENVRKQEPKRELKSEPKKLPPTPKKKKKEDDALPDVFPSLYPRRSRFPAAGVAVAVTLIAAGLSGYFISQLDRSGDSHAGATEDIASTEAPDNSELTSVNNPINDPGDPSEAINGSLDVPSVLTTTDGESEPILLAAGPKATPRTSGTATSPKATPEPSVIPADRSIAEKSAALERLRRAAEAAEKSHGEVLKQKEQAEAAAAEMQKTVDEKVQALAPMKKSAEELMTLRAEREEARKAAEAAALEAQQVAQEKARAAEAAAKALADLEKQNKERLAAAEKADIELQALQKSAAERQRAAADAAKAVADADARRQQQLAAIQQAEKDLADTRMAAEAAAQAERARIAREDSRKQIEKEFKELEEMKATFQRKMEELEAKRRSLEEPSSKPVAVPAVTPAPEPPVVPAPVSESKPAGAGTPDATLAMKVEPKIQTPPPATEKTALREATENSLGMRFVPVGDVQFSVWQTRVRDFEAFAKAVSLKSTAWRGPGFKQEPDHPVVNVTWQEAVAFCKWLTDRERKDGTLQAPQAYRLPTDLEWSKAVGLPDETGKTPEERDMAVPDVYPWGTQWPPPPGAGNYTGEETGSDVAIKGYDDGFAWTSPVGSFPPNKFGLYDMGGNVWQWCMDPWNSESKQKVLRGASWYNGALKLSLLSSCRVHAAPDSSTDNYGFRIVRASDSGKSTRR